MSTVQARSAVEAARIAVERAIPADEACLADEKECFRAHPIHEFATRNGRVESIYLGLDGGLPIITAAVLRWAAERTRDGSLDTVTCGCGCGCGNQLDRDADDLTREQRAVIADPGT